jgi:hypothetical protein
MGVKLGLLTSNVFLDRVLRRIFGLKKYEVTEGWKKLNTGKHNNLNSSPSVIYFSSVVVKALHYKPGSCRFETQ